MFKKHDYLLWHPNSGGVKVHVKNPAILRRLGLHTSPFATDSELRDKDSVIYFFPITDHAPKVDRNLTYRTR